MSTDTPAPSNEELQALEQLSKVDRWKAAMAVATEELEEKGLIPGSKLNTPSQEKRLKAKKAKAAKKDTKKKNRKNNRNMRG